MNKNLQQHPWLNMKSEDYLTKILEQLKQFDLEEEVFTKWLGNFKNESEYQLAIKIFFLIDYRPSTQSINNIKIYETQITQSMHELNKTNKILVSSNDIVDSSTHFIYPLAKQWKIDKSSIFRKSDLNDTIIDDKNNFFFVNPNCPVIFLKINLNLFTL